MSETLSYSHPKSPWCLLCYSTLCCDSSTDLINLYWHCSHHFCELYPTVKCVRLQCRPATLTNWNYLLIHALVNSPGLERGGKDTRGTGYPPWKHQRDFFPLLGTKGAGQGKRCFFNKGWQASQWKSLSPNQGSAEPKPLHPTINLMCDGLHITMYCSAVAAVPNKSVRAFSHPIRNTTQLGHAMFLFGAVIHVLWGVSYWFWRQHSRH